MRRNAYIDYRNLGLNQLIWEFQVRIRVMVPLEWKFVRETHELSISNFQFIFNLQQLVTEDMVFIAFADIRCPDLCQLGSSVSTSWIEEACRGVYGKGKERTCRSQAFRPGVSHPGNTGIANMDWIKSDFNPAPSFLGTSEVQYFKLRLHTCMLNYKGLAWLSCNVNSTLGRAFEKQTAIART